MGTPTATMRLTKPTINADGNGAWPADLNLNCDLIDRAMNQVISVSIPDTNISLEADGTSGDQAVYAVYNFTGVLTADRTVTLPANQKIGYAINATTGGHNVILSAGGTTFTLNNAYWHFFNCAGVDVGSPAVKFAALGGTVTNDDASTGEIGEFISSNVAPGSAILMGSSVASNVTSISLTAGDWDVWGNVGISFFSVAGSSAQSWIGTSSGTFPTDANGGGYSVLTLSSTVLSSLILSAGTRRLSLASTTTVYLGAAATFAGSATCYGFIGARRRR